MKKLDGKWIEGLDRFVALVESIERSEGKITQMDVDLLLQELRNLYMLTLSMDPHKYAIVEQIPENVKTPESKAAPKPESKPEPKPEPMAKPAPAPKPAAPIHAPIPEMGALPAASEPRFAPEETQPETKPSPSVEMHDGDTFHDLFESPTVTQAVPTPAPKPEPQTTPVPQPTPTPQTTTAAKPTPQPKPTPQQVQTRQPAPDQKPAPQPVPTPNPTPSPQPTPQPATQPKPAPAQPNQQPEKTQATSLIDFLHTPESRQGQARTLGETLGQNTATRSDQLAGHAQTKVADLRQVININDRFSFINDLFHNNIKAYNEFILILNSITDRQQAMDYISQVAEQYQWNSESATVLNFYAILDRKF